MRLDHYIGRGGRLLYGVRDEQGYNRGLFASQAEAKAVREAFNNDEPWPAWATDIRERPILHDTDSLQ